VGRDGLSVDAGRADAPADSQDEGELVMGKTTQRFLLVLGLLSAACTRPQETARVAVPAPEESSLVAEQADTSEDKAAQVWSKQAAAMEAAFAGERRDPFVPARKFFTTLTGIPIRVDGDFVGPLPSAETREDWERIQAWYRENHARLYWDEASGAVKVRSPWGSAVGGEEPRAISSRSRSFIQADRAGLEPVATRYVYNASGLGLLR
jgi:hypothetical protein